MSRVRRGGGGGRRLPGVGREGSYRTVNCCANSDCLWETKTKREEDGRGGPLLKKNGSCGFWGVCEFVGIV